MISQSSPPAYPAGDPIGDRVANPAVANGQSLRHHLRRVFGFDTFRENQEAVCTAVAAGRDVLLIMPTGSGKSLCYQLPTIARGGTALVVSPLIALMNDQAAKLASLGLQVARIHSGMERSAARQACIDYLRGDLQFLFLAPERLRVPGFVPMLAKRKPSLIAIDEAHCISQWGHDFRPDYRMLGEHIQALRPAPVIALTATATPLVQKDIAAQLNLGNPALFIHGFRRDNLAIELVRVPASERNETACKLLLEPSRQPAIVYTPTRKDAEALAAEIARTTPAAAYHAGLDAQTRERVQEQFLKDELRVVVATIAFGMGIDKPNVRTILHTALPGTLEGYYQEIGRAGRDGQPSRTILMHSYADQRTLSYFINRDYPPVDTLAKVYDALKGLPRSREWLIQKLCVTAEELDRTLDRLQAYGGAEVDSAGIVLQGPNRWRPAYLAQANHRRSQMDSIQHYAESSQCRMSALVQHFGGSEPEDKPCGICDFCEPSQCLLQRFRAPSKKEQRAAQEILIFLRRMQTISTGRLHKEVMDMVSISRNDFEELLGAMKQSGLIEIHDATFESDGRTIPYRKTSLTERGLQQPSGMPVDLLVRNEIEGREERTASPKMRGTAKGAASRSELSQEAKAIEQKLKDWRQAEAKRLRVPAYLILHDGTLRNLASLRPKNLEELLAVPGIGSAKADKHGEQILRLCI